MIVESIVDLIEQDPLAGHNHHELVALRSIIHDTVLILYFDRESIFAMHLLSNQTVPNPGRVESVMMILVSAL